MKNIYCIDYVVLTIIILMIIPFINSMKDQENGPYFPIHGKYCGLYHTSYYGEKPIDEIDRYCQFHDICVTLKENGLSSCWCNEQLYYLVSNLEPENEEVKGIKDSILYYLYISVARCMNNYNFDKKIMISRRRSESNKKGFNYLPIYNSINEKYEIESDKNITIYRIKKSEYKNFTTDVYDDPSLISKYDNYIEKQLFTKNKYIIKTNNETNIILYNNDVLNSRSLMIKNVTSCQIIKTVKINVHIY